MSAGYRETTANRKPPRLFRGGDRVEVGAPTERRRTGFGRLNRPNERLRSLRGELRHHQDEVHRVIS